MAIPLVVWLVAFRPSFLGGSTGYVQVRGDSMLPTLHDDDLLLVRRSAAYEVGQIVAYTVAEGSLRGTRIVHRIVAVSADGYTTRGDNRPVDDPWVVPAEQVIGRKVVRVPRAGVVLDALRSPVAVGVLAGLLVLALLWRPAMSRADDAGSRRWTARAAPRRALSKEMRATAVAVRRRQSLASDPQVRAAVRALAMDLAAAHAALDARFDRVAFLDACGMFGDGDGGHADESAQEVRPATASFSSQVDPPATMGA